MEEANPVGAEAAHQAQVQALEERQRAVWEKKLATPFDAGTQTMLMKPLMVDACIRAANIGADAIAKAQKSLSRARGDTEVSGLISEGIASLDLRLQLLKAMVGEESSVQSPDEAKARLDMVKHSEDMKKAPEGEPCAYLESLVSKEELLNACSSFKLSGWEHMAEEEKIRTRLCRQFSDYAKLVSAQAGRITTLVNKKENAREKESEKRQWNMQSLATEKKHIPLQRQTHRQRHS